MNVDANSSEESSGDGENSAYEEENLGISLKRQRFSGRKGGNDTAVKAGKPQERILSPEEMLDAIHEPGMPSSAEVTNMGGPSGNARISFRFRTQIFAQHNQLLRYEGQEVRVYSPLEGNCLYKCLAHLCRETDYDWQAYEEAFAAAQLAGTSDNGGSHSY